MIDKPRPINKLRIVKHNFSGYLPLFELQVYSANSNQWHIAHTGLTLDDCQKYALKFDNLVLDDNIVICIH